MSFLNRYRARGWSSLNCLHDLRRQPKSDIFRHDFHFFDRAEAVIPQIGHYIFDQNFRR